MFELTEHTRQAIDDYLNSAHKQPSEYLFAGRRYPPACTGTWASRSIMPWPKRDKLTSELLGQSRHVLPNHGRGLGATSDAGGSINGSAPMAFAAGGTLASTFAAGGLSYRHVMQRRETRSDAKPL